MRQKLVLCIFLVLFLVSCKDENIMDEDRNTAEAIVENQEVTYQMFSEIVWNEDMEEIYKLVDSGARQYAKEINDEFVAVLSTDDAFSNELIETLEKAFYSSCNSETIIEADNEDKSIFNNAIKGIDVEEFQLNLEKMCELFSDVNKKRDKFLNKYEAIEFIIGRENCIDMFFIDDYYGDAAYVLVYDMGGSSGECWIEINRKEENEFVSIGGFLAQSSGDIIRFEEQYYYVCKIFNFNIGTYDGICVYNLNTDPQESKLVIRYLPYEYVWNNIYSVFMEHEFEERLNSYIESIKEEIVLEKYLENGSGEDIGIYLGDEIPATDFVLTDERSTYYAIDMVNIGTPVYVKKTNRVSSGKWSNWYLKAQFYLWNKENAEATEITGWEIGKSAPFPNSAKLVQMWFKEIEGRVVTFRLYHISDYNYLLNVILLEGNELKQIRNDIFSPKRQFVIE